MPAFKKLLLKKYNMSWLKIEETVGKTGRCGVAPLVTNANNCLPVSTYNSMEQPLKNLTYQGCVISERNIPSRNQREQRLPFPWRRQHIFPKRVFSLVKSIIKEAEVEMKNAMNCLDLDQNIQNFRVHEALKLLMLAMDIRVDVD